MARVNIVQISIKNWSKYQERPDRKNYTWFKFERDFFEDSKIYGLSKDQKLLFIFLLCQRNKSEKNELDILLDLVTVFLSISQEQLINDIGVLKVEDLIEVKSLSVLNPAKAVMTPSLDKIRGDKIREESSGGQNFPNFAPQRIQEFIGIYVKAFKKKYPDGRPTLHGKAQGQIKRFLKDYPFERACDLIQVYFQMEEQWFETKAFDFSTFLENLQKIELALDTGKQVRPQSELESWLKNKLKNGNGKALTPT